VLQASLVSLSVEDVSAALGCARNIYSPVMKVSMELHTLKGQCHEISTLGILHESVTPKPLSIPLGLFRVFSQILREIRSSRCTIGVVDTGGKWKKSSIRKVLIIFLDTFAASVIDTGGKLPLVHLDLRISPRILAKI
jgi:hypothetical protein